MVNKCKNSCMSCGIIEISLFTRKQKTAYIPVLVGMKSVAFKSILHKQNGQTQ